MANIKALGMDADGNVIVLEKDTVPPDVIIFRSGPNVYIEKAKFDTYITEFKLKQGVKFNLTGYSVFKSDKQTFYVFNKLLYRQVGTLLKLPAFPQLEEKNI